MNFKVQNFIIETGSVHKSLGKFLMEAGNKFKGSILLKN